VRADDFLLPGFFEDVHHRAIARSPVAFRQAVHKYDVELLGAEFTAEAVEIGAHFVWIACPGLGEDGDFASIKVLEGFGHMRVATVRISGVEEAEAVFVEPVEQEKG